MDRLTTSEEYPHGAEGKSVDRLTGHYCRGEFEATACVEKLSRYEDTELEPEEIMEMKERNKVQKMYKPNPNIYCCPMCGEKIAPMWDYCPWCGQHVTDNQY